MSILQGFTGQQLSMVESSTMMIEEREKEIQSIVQSISDINEMYRDLATMVVDQVRRGDAISIRVTPDCNGAEWYCNSEQVTA